LTAPADRAPGVGPWRPIDRYGEEGFRQELDRVAEEVPVALNYNGQPYAVMLASPTDLPDFALGFSLTEGIVECAQDITAITVREELSGIDVQLTIPEAAAARLAPNRRTLAGNSGCGLCGTRLLEDVIRWPPPVSAELQVSSAAIARGLAGLKARQPMFLATGATHAAAWCSLSGEVQVLREDVGRHNALDKLVGALAAAGITRREGILLLTSRASYEMVQKAAWSGFPVVAAVSAPTALAVAMAERANLTLLGLARDGHFVAYSHPGRLADYPGAAAIKGEAP
jgi:FdhD protein